MTTMRSRSLSSFGTAFRDARIRAGLTQVQLSDESRVSRRSIIRWEAGEVSPWMPELLAALEVLGARDSEASALVGFLETGRSQRTFDPMSVERQARILRMSRVRAGLKPSDVGRKIGCDPTTVQRWEAGRLSPNQDELTRIWAVLGVSRRELEELANLDFATPLEGNSALDERISGIEWPWDKEGYRLFDVRYIHLSEQIGSSNHAVGRQEWNCRAKSAYSWKLATCGRFRQAADLANEVLDLYERGDVTSSRQILIAAIVSARCSSRSESERAQKRGIQSLDKLCGRPLDWELLACRFDAYTEAYAFQGSFAKALEFSDRAIDAASKCGERLTKLMRFNKCRVLLMTGCPKQALEFLPEFSESTPFNDANEALTLAAIYEGLNLERQADHWRIIAAGLVEKFQLETVLNDKSSCLWSVPPLFSTM